MSKFANAYTLLILCLNPFSPLLADDASMATEFAAPALEAPTSIQNEPAIRSRFFSAEAVEAIPKLQYLNAKNPGFNKILFKLDGYPVQKEIIFEIRRPLSPKPDLYQQVASFTIQEDGSYLLPDNERVPFIVGSSRGFLPGERIIFRFRTADGSIDKQISGIPSPAIFRDKKGNIALRAEILSEDPTVYILDLLEMKDGDEYELKTVSLGETVTSKGKYYRSKPLHYSPAPDASGKGGTSLLQVIPRSGDSKGEVYTMRLPWGTALEVYQLGGKTYPYHN